MLIILLTPSGELILQQRDNNPLGAAHLRGKVGFFGGHMEHGETPLVAIVREIQEELEFPLEKTAITQLGVFKKQPLVHGDANFVYVFRYQKPVQPSQLMVHEGVGYRLVNKDNAQKLSFTPFAGQLVASYFGINNELQAYRYHGKVEA